MFFRLPFWIWLGDLACTPSRNRRQHKPVPQLSEEEAKKILVPELTKPFEPDPIARDAYRRAAVVTESIDKAVCSSEDLRKHAQALFNNDNLHALRAAEEQWSICEKTIKEIRQLLETPKWQLPINTAAQMDLPELQKFKLLDLVMQLRAGALWMSGDEEGALELFETAALLASRLQNCEGFLIHELVGSSCKSRLSRVVRSGIKGKDGSDEFLSRLDALFDSSDDLKERLYALIGREFSLYIVPNVCLRGEPWNYKKAWNIASALTVAAHAQLLLVEWILRNHPNPVDRQQTLREVSKCFETIKPELIRGWSAVASLKKLGEEYGKGIPPICKQIFVDATFGILPTTVIAAEAALRRIDNAYGRIGLSKICDMSANVIASSYRIKAEQSATRICIAAARLRARGTTGPLDSLYTLIHSGLLDFIPEDPISGLPFRLDVQTQSVWLPGPNNLHFQQVYEGRQKGGDFWWWAL